MAATLRQTLRERGAWANIKPMPTRKNLPALIPYLHRHRNMVEPLFNKFKYRGQIAEVDPDSGTARSEDNLALVSERWLELSQGQEPDLVVC